ncbi:MAG: sigma-70 family RNA polymerase sigma factor [Gemmatimonadota bacterium]
MTLRTDPPADSPKAVKPEHWLWYNCCRCRVAKLVARVDGELTARAARELLGWLNLALTMRNAIVAANRGLSYHVANKIRGLPMDADDIVSEADTALIRSVEYFDFRRGVMFSSYAVRAMINRIRRACRPSHATDGLEADTIAGEEDDSFLDPDIAAIRRVLRENAAGLSPLEHRVLKLRFGLERSCDPREAVEQRENAGPEGWFFPEPRGAWHDEDADAVGCRRAAQLARLTVEGAAEIERRALEKLAMALR